MNEQDGERDEEILSTGVPQIAEDNDIQGKDEEDFADATLHGPPNRKRPRRFSSMSAEVPYLGHPVAGPSGTAQTPPSESPVAGPAGTTQDPPSESCSAGSLGTAHAPRRESLFIY